MQMPAEENKIRNRLRFEGKANECHADVVAQ